MKMKRWPSSRLQASTASSLISLAAFTLLTTIGVAEAVACTCAPVRTETSCRDLAGAKAIFAGEVISIAPVMRDINGKQVEVERRVTLRVLEAFDGVDATEVAIVTATNSAACGYHFDKGRRYLVYAFGRPDGALTTSICSRTKPLANIVGELSFLRATATSQTTRVTGRVRLREYDYGKGQLSPRPVVGARFVLSAGERRFEAVSDRDGEFAVDVPAGKYGVELIVGDRLYVEGWSQPPRQMDLSDTRACPHVDAVARHDGRFTGRILTADGRPAADLALEILTATGRSTPFKGRTNARGEFDIRRVAPGNYLLRLVSDPRVWLPTPGTHSDPIEMSLDPGQHRALGDLALPAGLRLARLSGRVVDADGRPIAGAEVVVRGGTDRTLDAAAPAVTDAAGNFSTAVATSSAPYRVIVWIDDGWGWGTKRRHSITDVAEAEISRLLILRPQPHRE